MKKGLEGGGGGETGRISIVSFPIYGCSQESRSFDFSGLWDDPSENEI